MATSASLPLDQTKRPPVEAAAIRRVRESARDSTFADWVAGQVELDETSASADSSTQASSR